MILITDFPRKKIGFDDSVDVTKCLQQIEKPDLLHICATVLFSLSMKIRLLKKRIIKYMIIYISCYTICTRKYFYLCIVKENKDKLSIGSKGNRQKKNYKEKRTKLKYKQTKIKESLL